MSDIDIMIVMETAMSSPAQAWAIREELRAVLGASPLPIDVRARTPERIQLTTAVRAAVRAELGIDPPLTGSSPNPQQAA